MTLDITMCGDYAGTPAILEATCGPLASDQTCYSKFKLGLGGHRWRVVSVLIPRGLAATYVLNSTVYNEAYVSLVYPALPLCSLRFRYVHACGGADFPILLPLHRQFQINYLNICGGDDSIDPELSTSSPADTGSSTQSGTESTSEVLGMGTATSSARITGTTVAGPGSNLVNAGVGPGFAAMGIAGAMLSLPGIVTALALVFL